MTKHLVVISTLVVGIFMLTGCGRMNPSSTPSASSTPESSVSSSLPSLSLYPSVIQQSLGYLKSRTRLPLGGPTRLPSHAKGVWSVIASTGQNSWSLQGFLTNQSYPLNRVTAIEAPSHQSDYEVGPEFTVGLKQLSHTPGPSTVFSTLYSAVNIIHIPYSQLTSGSATQVSLANGVRGTAYGNLTNGTLVWKEGGWTFITTDSMKTNETMANKMIQTMRGETLPATPGVINLVSGVHGLEEYLAWMKGRDLFTASGYCGGHDVMNGMALALSWKNR